MSGIIDVMAEDTLTLAEACRVLPRGRNGSRPHLSTVLRWILQGAPAYDGRRVKLAAVRGGAKWVTSRAAIREFVEALTPPPDGEAARPPRTAKQRQRESERAGRELDEAWK
jgi:hypothetical protein